MINRIKSFVKGLVTVLVVDAVLLSIIYWALANRVKDLPVFRDQQAVKIVGRVTSVQEDFDNNAVYEVQDVTGTVFVVSNNSGPVPKDVLIVFGKKSTTDADRVVVLEDYRWNLLKLNGDEEEFEL